MRRRWDLEFAEAVEVRARLKTRSDARAALLIWAA